MPHEVTCPVTAIVLTLNEEENIGPCLDTLTWADEVVVLDSLSEDRTVEIARARGATVHQRPFTNYADQRNAALDLTGGGRTHILIRTDAGNDKRRAHDRVNYPIK